MSRHNMIKTSFCAIAMAMTMSVFGATPVVMPGTGMVELAQQPANLRRGDVAIGLLPATQSMHIVVSLKLRNQSELDSFIARSQRRDTVLAQRSMPADDFIAMFAPTKAQAAAVVDYLTRSGFTNIEVATNRQLVSADAPADAVQAAFHVGLVKVRTHDGRDAYANTGAVMIPATLRDVVVAVMGLQTIHTFHTSAHPVANHYSSVRKSSVPGFSGYDPTEFATIYGASGTANASAVPVGIISEGSMTSVLRDLTTFTTSHHLPAVATQVVGKGSSDTAGDDEWDIDSQDIVGMSGGVKKLTFYAASSLKDGDISLAINAAVSANSEKIINVSLDECEIDAKADGMAAATDQILKQAVAQGQTFSVSSGDSGAQECSGSSYPPLTVSYPASSPYVTAVGGTVLFTSSDTYTSEVVWGQSPTEASGGGPSNFEPLPLWQTGIGENADQTTRGVPDIAFDAAPAEGSVIVLHGNLAQYGGTSLSAPLFAGAWARVLAAKGSNFGFASPRLYQLPADSFNDVLSGDNLGYSAFLGWDYASGFGSLRIGQAIHDFSVPIASFSFTNKVYTVNFTDTSNDWNGKLSKHVWTFGDGSTSTDANPSHTYATFGSFEVTESVTDGASGNTGSIAQSVYVQGPPPVVDFLAYPDLPLENTFFGNVEFFDLSRDQGDGSVVIDWDFGDGSSDHSYGLGSAIYHKYVVGGTYRVTEVLHDSLSGTGSIAKAILVPPVQAPSITLPAASDGGYTVSWSAVTGATYYVLLQQAPYDNWVIVSKSQTRSWFSTTDLGPHASGTFKYQVQACNAAGCGTLSAVASITVTLGVQALPPRLAPNLFVTPKTGSTGDYTVEWQPILSEPSSLSYELQMSNSEGAFWVAAIHARGYSLVVHGKPPGTYDYRVRACNGSGCGPWSTVVEVVVSLP